MNGFRQRKYSVSGSTILHSLYSVLITIICLFHTTFTSFANVRASVSKDYDKWRNIPSLQLKEKANIFLDKDMPDSALVCYTVIANRLSEATSRTERLQCASAIMNVGYMFSAYFYDFHHAFDDFSQALKVAQEENDSSLMITCYVNLGSLYGTYHQMVDDQSMLDEAIKMYCNAYRLSKKVGYTTSLLTSISNLAVVSFLKENNDSVSNILNDFLNLNNRDNSERWMHIKAFITGLLAVSNGEGEKAEKYLKESLTYQDKNAVPHKDETIVLLALALNSCKNGSLQDSEKLYLETLKQAEKYGFRDIVSISYDMLVDVYKAQENVEKANEYRLKYFDFKDSLVRASKIKDVKNLHFLEELNTKNEEVARLSSQKKNQRRILSVTLWSLLVVGIVLVIIIIHTKRLRKRNLELYDRLQESLVKRNEESAKAVVDLLPPVKELPTDTTEKETKYKHSTLSEEGKLEIMSRVKNFLSSSEEIYSPDFTLDQLGEILDINRSYLSQAINETGGTNFKTLLNSYRILEACRRFEDSATYGGQTIEAIGQSVGFLSRRNFGLAFKKETGLSPSAFVKAYQEKQNDR